jgi:hypothetical protein
MLGSIAALAAGAGAAWGQAPMPIASAGGQPMAVMAGEILPASGPAPVIMPPIAVGPPGDPMGLGPVAGIGPPPGPMYPTPGPYAAPLFQPPPGGLGGGDGGRCAPRWWFDGEYLLWFASSQPVNFPLLTTSAPAASGLLGLSSTIELVPANDINYSAISGFRLSGGFYGDADRRFGALVSGFYTEQKGVDQRFGTSFGSTGIPLLARPFIDTTGVSSSLVVTDTAFGTGGAVVSTWTSTWGIEASALWNLFRSPPDKNFWCSVDLLAGYKFLQNTEELRIESFTTLTGARLIPIFVPGPFGVPIQVGVRILPSPVPVGGVVTGAPATVQVLDRIRASNRFNGGVFGVRHETRFGMWSVQAIGKLGVGNMHQVLEFQGATNFFNPATGRTGATYGGLFANSTNIGKWNHDEFTLIPELTVNLGVNLTRSLTMFVGYNFMYISNVARPGNQVNPVVDSTTIPFSPTFGALGNPPGTQVLFVQDDFWLQGVNFGMSIRY